MKKLLIITLLITMVVVIKRVAVKEDGSSIALDTSELSQRIEGLKINLELE